MTVRRARTPGARFARTEPKRRRAKGKTEHQHQTLLVGLLRTLHPELVVAAVPNGGLRNKREAVKLRKEGVLAGFPDLVIARPRYPFHGLYLEMKRSKVDGGRSPTARQKKVHKRLQAEGYCVRVAYGAEEGLRAVEEYLELPEWTSGASLILFR